MKRVNHPAFHSFIAIIAIAMVYLIWLTGSHGDVFAMIQLGTLFLVTLTFFMNVFLQPTAHEGVLIKGETVFVPLCLLLLVLETMLSKIPAGDPDRMLMVALLYPLVCHVKWAGAVFFHSKRSV